MLLTLGASIHSYLRAGAPGAAGHSQRLQQPLQEAQHRACWTYCTFPTKLVCNPAGVPVAAWAVMISRLHKAKQSSPYTGSLILPSYCVCTETISHAFQLFDIVLFLERIQFVSLWLFSTKVKVCELFLEIMWCLINRQEWIFIFVVAESKSLPFKGFSITFFKAVCLEYCLYIVAGV